MRVDSKRAKDNCQGDGSKGSLLHRLEHRLFPSMRNLPLVEQASKGMRERILLAVVLIGMVFSGLAAVPAVLLTIREKFWFLLVLDVLVFLCGIGLIFSKSLRYEARAWTASALIYMVGVYVIFFFGFLSGGPIWIFSFPVVCGLLLGLRPAIMGVGVNALTLVALAWLHSSTSLGDDVPFFSSWLNAFAAGGNFLFLNVLVATSCALLLKDEKEASLSLKNEKTQLEAEIITRKEAEKKQRELARELEFLNAAAIELVTVSDEETLYRLIGRRIKAILGDVVVIVNSFDPKTRQFCTMAIDGLGPAAERILNILGRNPVGMISTLNDDRAEHTLKTGRLSVGPGGIHELSFGAVPKSVALSLEKLLGMRLIYVVGFVREEELFGSAVIVDLNRGEDSPLEKNSALVEAYVNQAALAILRDRSERELRESEERYRQLVDSAPAGIYELDLENFVITNVNKVMCEYTGYTREEFLALNPLSLLAEESLGRYVERGRAIFAGEPITGSTEYTMLRKDGSEFWVRFQSRVDYSEGLPAKLKFLGQLSPECTLTI
jgi:PAS domain S-box-containing protein